MRAVSQFTFLHVTTDSGLMECVPSLKKKVGGGYERSKNFCDCAFDHNVISIRRYNFLKIALCCPDIASDQLNNSCMHFVLLKTWEL